MKFKIYNEAQSFLMQFFSDLSFYNFNLEKNFLDHLCYRVDSSEMYFEYKKIFLSFSKLLIESKVGGRNISTFKLVEPISFRNREIHIIELPAPKIDSDYIKGFEHGEFVITESFKSFESLYLKNKFDWKGTSKKYNPELRFILQEGRSVKFHHQSLEQVIEFEQSKLKDSK